MEQARTNKDKVKSAGKWLGLLVLTILLSRFLEPALDWLFDLIVEIGTSFSKSYTDQMYMTAANVYMETIPRISVALLSIGFMYFMLIAPVLNHVLGNLTSIKNLVGVIYLVAFLAPSLPRAIEAENIRSATLRQIDILKPYSSNTDELYSTFLLVQSEKDYRAVWHSVMAVATKEKVVLPAFARLMSVDED